MELIIPCIFMMFLFWKLNKLSKEMDEQENENKEKWYQFAFTLLIAFNFKNFKSIYEELYTYNLSWLNGKNSLFIILMFFVVKIGWKLSKYQAKASSESNKSENGIIEIENSEKKIPEKQTILPEIKFIEWNFFKLSDMWNRGDFSPYALRIKIKSDFYEIRRKKWLHFEQKKANKEGIYGSFEEMTTGDILNAGIAMLEFRKTFFSCSEKGKCVREGNVLFKKHSKNNKLLKKHINGLVPVDAPVGIQDKWFISGSLFSFWGKKEKPDHPEILTCLEEKSSKIWKIIKLGYDKDGHLNSLDENET